ncbi:hypothetical protein BDB01DRAFT_810177 [Pilobolus umbonatus]|nr:hypothetical protein BDB01DRAFT_810177 [Pilobolus umbonatus]
MVSCTGNDYIVSINIEQKEVIIIVVHEKDEECRGSLSLYEMGTSCIVTEDLDILAQDYMDAVIEDRWYTRVDNETIFFIPCVVKEFYQVCQISKRARTRRDELVVDVFSAYVKLIVRNFINKYASALNGVVHWVMTIPDSWHPEYMDSIKQQLVYCGVGCIGEIPIIKHTDALIRRLQSPRFKNEFVNGDYYILCSFKPENMVTLYGFEIGPPIKGLKSIADYRLTEKVDLELASIDEYIVTELFGGDRQKAEKFNTAINSITYNGYNVYDGREAIYSQPRIGERKSFMSILDSINLSPEQKALRENWRKVIKNDISVSEEELSQFREEVEDLSEVHHNTKVIIINNRGFIFDDKINQFKYELPAKMKTIYYQYKEDVSHSFVIGAAQVIQDQLRIANYLPRIIHKKRLVDIAGGNTLYIDITWDNVSMLYADSNKRASLIRDASTRIKNCYSLNQCLRDCSPIHKSNILNIETTEKLIQMIQLDQKTLDSLSSHSDTLIRLDGLSHSEELIRSHRSSYSDAYIHSEGSHHSDGSTYSEASPCSDDGYTNLSRRIKRRKARKFLNKILPDFVHMPTPSNSTRSVYRQSLDVSSATRAEVDKILELNPVLRNLHLIVQHKRELPENSQTKLLEMYIESLQIRIARYLVSHEYVKDINTVEYHITIEQSILDTFCMGYEPLRHRLLHPLSTLYPLPPMKLLKREQIIAVFCKDELKCYQTVEEYLDYPQYVVQVNMEPKEIHLSLNMILPLNKNMKTARDETVLTLKRRRVPFDMVDMMAEKLWDHIQARKEINTCPHHRLSDYSDHIELYLRFIEYFKDYFTLEFTIANEEGLIDWYRNIPIRLSAGCDCSFTLTPIDLFDICIHPAIDHLTSIVYASVTDPCQFGTYRTDHLVIMGTFMTLKNCAHTYAQTFMRFKDAVQGQQKYYNTLSIQWISSSIQAVLIKGIKSMIKNPTGGLLEQVFAGTYKFICDEPLHLDHQHEETCTEETSYTFISEATRITEEMREDGKACYLYPEYGDFSLDNYFVAYGEQDSTAKKIGGFYATNIAFSYPVVLRVFPGINELMLRASVNANGELGDKYGFVGPLILSENVLLSAV